MCRSDASTHNGVCACHPPPNRGGPRLRRRAVSSAMALDDPWRPPTSGGASTPERSSAKVVSFQAVGIWQSELDLILGLVIGLTMLLLSSREDSGWETWGRLIAALGFLNAAIALGRLGKAIRTRV